MAARQKVSHHKQLERKSGKTVVVKQISWGGHSLLSLYGEGRSGRAPAEQLTEVFGTLDRQLREQGLSLDNAVRHRLWTRTREARDASNEARARLIAGHRRCATSSFIDRNIFVSDGDVAVELIAQYPAAAPDRRLVDFSPPRRYARYLVQDGLMFVSGMAEEGATLETQFDNAMREVAVAMSCESVDWRDVFSAQLFLERGDTDPTWLLQRFRAAVGFDLPYLDCQEVDGLASPDKHLEIEITARLAGR